MADLLPFASPRTGRNPARAGSRAALAFRASQRATPAIDTLHREIGEAVQQLRAIERRIHFATLNGGTLRADDIGQGKRIAAAVLAAFTAFGQAPEATP